MNDSPELAKPPAIKQESHEMFADPERLERLRQILTSPLEDLLPPEELEEYRRIQEHNRCVTGWIRPAYEVDFQDGY